MITLHSCELALPDQQEDFSSSSVGIERGLSYLAQGRLTEGLEALHKASLLLPAQETPLAAALATLQETTDSFLHAQQRLHESSRHFAAVEREWQTQIETLDRLLRAGHTASRSVPSTEHLYTHQILRMPSASRATPLADISTSQPGEAADARLPPPLYILCFGRFTVKRAHPGGPELELCRNSRGQTILRYLLAQPERQATLDMLMADLWPEEDALSARHKLQVAISALRCSLNRESIQAPGAGYILYKERMYQLNPAVAFHTDVAAFYRLYQAGKQASEATITADRYQQACKLYTGPFLVEDLYAEWSFMAREEAVRTYLRMCEWLASYSLAHNDYETTLTRAADILKVDRCNEEAYRLVMRAFAALGRRGEAVRRYQQCQRTLAEDLGVEPMPETQQVLQMIMRGR